MTSEIRKDISAQTSNSDNSTTITNTNSSISFDSSPSSINSSLRPLPVFGNLFDLGLHPHRKLSRSSVYGDVVQLQLGKWKTLILNGSEACKAALIQNGKHTASRPDFESYRHYSHGKSLSFQPYDGIWQIQRKATSRIIAKLINSGVVSKLAADQANTLIDAWTKKGKISFDPEENISKTVGEFVYSFCYGENEHLLENKEFSDILLRPNPGTDLLAAGNNIDFLPWFLRFTMIGKQKNHIHRMNEFVRLNDLMRTKVQNKLNEQSITSDDDDESFSKKNFTSVMQGMILEVQKLFKDCEDEIEIHDSVTSKKSILHRNYLLNLPSEFLSAGSETSTAVLLWLIRFVSTHRDVQDKIFSELDDYVKLKKLDDPNKNAITHDDRISLPYTEASFIESLRLMAVVPFGLPHFTTADIQLNDKNIPKNTLILPNLWSAGRDARHWEGPDIYSPERHFVKCPVKDDRDMNSIQSPLISKLENCFPFGLGRRRCVGEPVGKMFNFIVFANLMLRFKIEFIEEEESLIPLTASNIGNIFKNIAGFFLRKISPSLTSSIIGDENVTESYGDVMKPRPFKIILTQR